MGDLSELGLVKERQLQGTIADQLLNLAGAQRMCFASGLNGSVCQLVEKNH